MNASRTSLALACFLAACSSSSSSSPPDLPCPSGDCGQTPFRRAVPTRDKVRIDHPTGTSARRREAGTPPPRIGRARAAALEAVSPALLAVDEQVVQIDEVVEDIFGDFEACAMASPEIATDTEHQWRIASPDAPGHDAVLRLTTTNAVDFEVAYFIVAKGAAPDTAAPLVGGAIKLADDEITELELEIDLDAIAAIDPSFDGSGSIVAAVKPFEGGESEHWFDFHDASFGGGGPVENSRTTAWSFAEDSGALEFVADVDGEQATVYARWDARGGRYDHHLAFVDPDVGPVEQIATNCWDPTGAESFDAWAVIDQELNYYGELDGDESACAFGPVADHPSPSDEFDDLPEAGDWDLIELLSWCEASSDC